jgi:hypothetical protein
MKVYHLIFIGDIMPRIFTSFVRSGDWFYYTSYGGRVREIYYPQPSNRRAIEIPLPRPMSVDDVEAWVRRNRGAFLNFAVNAFDRISICPEDFTLEPLCSTCGNVINNFNFCVEISTRRTCDECRAISCRACQRVDCDLWVNSHPEHAETLRRREDPIGW